MRMSLHKKDFQSFLYELGVDLLKYISMLILRQTRTRNIESVLFMLILFSCFNGAVLIPRDMRNVQGFGQAAMYSGARTAFPPSILVNYGYLKTGYLYWLYDIQ